MPSTKEIRTKIGSVKNTQKITKAMEMVAASKMRKTQDAMLAARPYAETIRKLISHIALGALEYKHPYFEERKVSRVGYIIISSDRGLCGGLNMNLFKKTLENIKSWHEENVDIDIAIIGTKATTFFKSYGGNIVAQVSGIGDKPELNDFIGVVNAMVREFDSGKVDKLYLASNEFINTMVQKPNIEQLLPLPKSEEEDMHRSPSWDYIYEPDPKAILDHLLRKYIESQVYHGVIENLACEQAARMVAMKAATDNAGNLIDELQLVYNKARQAAITQEISEIVSGASAV